MNTQIHMKTGIHMHGHRHTHMNTQIHMNIGTHMHEHRHTHMNHRHMHTHRTCFELYYLL